jgi:hypothetical protein
MRHRLPDGQILVHPEAIQAVPGFQLVAPAAQLLLNCLLQQPYESVPQLLPEDSMQLNLRGFIGASAACSCKTADLMAEWQWLVQLGTHGHAHVTFTLR